MNKKSILSLLTLGALCLWLFAGFAVARQITTYGSDKGSKNVNKIIHLKPGTAEPKATGIAKIQAKNKGKKPSQDFQVVGANLKAGSTYTLFVDGAQIASKTAAAEKDDGDTADSDDDDDDGTGAAVEFRFSSKVKADSTDDGEDGPKPLPTSLNPVTKIRRVELKDAGGQVVLSGEFATTAS